MTSLHRNLCAAILALTSATSFAAVPAAANVVFQPHFETTHGNIDAGKAFVISTKTCAAVVVSAYHLFGEAGGLKAQIPVAELTPSIKSIVLNNIATGKSVFKIAGTSVTPPGAAACCETDAPMTGAGDVFAFRSKTDLGSVAMAVSDNPAKKGDRLHILTSVMGGARTEFDAVVVGMVSGYLQYQIVTPGFVLRATSGAPVLDADGRVVAINLGGWNDAKTGATFGIGNPATAWLGAVEAQCK